MNQLALFKKGADVGDVGYSFAKRRIAGGGVRLSQMLRKTSEVNPQQPSDPRAWLAALPGELHRDTSCCIRARVSFCTRIVYNV